MGANPHRIRYVLISAVRNEEALIRNTLESICAQSVLPECWVIVDDGSIDRTPDIVGGYSQRYPWIQLLRRPRRPANGERSFAAKAEAVHAGYARVQSLDFEVVGNLDADVSFDHDYLSFLVGKFAQDSKLGVAGTPFLEDGYDSARDSFEGANHVAGGVQLFRRQCFDDVGQYVPNHAGGIDWVAVTTARMKGWKTQSFPEKRFKHHRALGTASRGMLAAFFAHGQKDYYLGGAPTWQLFRVGYRSLKRPFIVGGLAVALGYSWAAIRGTPRAVSPELMRFHRGEQWIKLKAIIGGIARLRRVTPAGLPPPASADQPATEPR